MSRSSTIIKAMAVEGKHLRDCMADGKKREEGRRLCWRAKRIAKRLGVELSHLGVAL